MNCRRAQSLISDYIDNCLAEPLCVELDAHFAECPPCREELAATRSLVSALSTLKAPMPFNCWEQVRKRLAEPSVDAPARRWMFLRPAWAMPALAALAALVAFLLWPSSMPKNAPATASLSTPEYAAYISAHNRARRQEAFADPSVRFVAAELETAYVGSR